MIERGETLPMRRRKLLLGAVAVALLGVVGFSLFLWLATPTPGVTWENFRRLRAGMSARDVERLLGQPLEVEEAGRCTIRLWQGEKVKISLTFEEDVLGSGEAFPPQSPRYGLMIGPVEHMRPAEESLLDRIRRWLHW
jgi:hypothetical protein